MKKSYKILLFLVSLAGLGISACILSQFYPVSTLTETVGYYRTVFPWIDGVFAGFSAFVFICFFILLLVSLLSPRKLNDMVIAKSKGKLHFAKQAVESTVFHSYADVEGINLSKVRVKLNKNPEKIKIFVKASLCDTSELVGLTETIQNRIASAMESSLGIAVKSIEVSVAEFRADNGKDEKGISEQPLKTSRVV